MVVPCWSLGRWHGSCQSGVCSKDVDGDCRQAQRATERLELSGSRAEELREGCECGRFQGTCAGGRPTQLLTGPGHVELSSLSPPVRADVTLAEEANEEQLADFCLATIQGAMLLGKIRRDSRPVETAVREALVHLKGYAKLPG